MTVCADIFNVWSLLFRYKFSRRLLGESNEISCFFFMGIIVCV